MKGLVLTIIIALSGTIASAACTQASGTFGDKSQNYTPAHAAQAQAKQTRSSHQSGQVLR